MAAVPLPNGGNTSETIRRLRAIDAEIFGSIYARAGTLSDLTINGTLTMGTDGIIRTAASGQRIELTNTWRNEISLYSGDASELYNARIKHLVSGVAGARSIVTRLVAGSLVKSSADNDADIAMSSTSQDDATSNATIHFNTRIAGDPTSAERLRLDGLKAWFTTPVHLQAGTASAPVLSFLTDPNTGLYSYGADTIGFTAAGVGRMRMSPTYLNSDTTSGFTLKHAAGTAGAPTFTFLGDLDTGMYRASANVLALVAGGTGIVKLQSNYLYDGIASGSTGMFGIKVNTAGTAATPTYSFLGDLNTGMYRVQTDVLGLSAGGTHGVRVSNTNFRSINSTTGNANIKISGAGTMGLPTYSFVAATNTGMYLGTTTQLIWSCGNVNEMYLSNTQFVVPNVYNDSVAGSANVLVQSNGRLRRATSALKYKTNVYTADLADIPLRPVGYTDKRAGTLHLGFIADEIASHHSRIGVYDKGELEDYDTRAVMAIMAAKINKLEEQMEQCKC